VQRDDRAVPLTTWPISQSTVCRDFETNGASQSVEAVSEAEKANKNC
jgi:hypothetical protein